MKTRSKHMIGKQLERELKHQQWLEKNVAGSKVLRKSKLRILKLHTERAFATQKKTKGAEI